MVENNLTEKPDRPKIDKQGVKVRLRQAAESIEMALAVCCETGDERIINTHISCAHSFLFEATARTGKKQPWEVL